MSSIELLEDRIAELEKQVYGLGKTVTKKDTPPENSVIDSLLHANTLISSALSGREKAASAMKRLPELNNYLDPVFECSEIPIDAKLQLLLVMEPEIEENYRLLTEMQELMPALETNHLRDVPDLSSQLNDLSLSYLKLYKDSEEFNSNINEILLKYNAVITSISKSLVGLDAAVRAAEIAAQPKKQLD